MNQNILVVDDDREIVDAIEFYLRPDNFNVLKAYDGLEALDILIENDIKLIIMDVMMPNLDGLKTTLKIREKRNIPIILLSAKSEDMDKIIGLNMGADDYITKPFSIKELLARISSVLRRYNLTSLGEENNILTTGNLKLDLSKHEVTKGSEKIELTLKEFELLKLLIQNKGKVLSRNYLLDKIWGYEYYGETRTEDVHIRYLSKKIEDEDKSEKYIETIRGVGYKID